MNDQSSERMFGESEGNLTPVLILPQLATAPDQEPCWSGPLLSLVPQARALRQRHTYLLLFHSVYT